MNLLWITRAATIVLLAFISACAPKSMPPIVQGGVVDQEAKRQQELIVKGYVERIARVDRVGMQILTANRDLCPGITYGALGLIVKTRTEVYPPYRDAAKFFLGIDDRPRVLTTVPGGPADKAGVRVGDIVLTVNGKKCTGFNDVIMAGYTGFRVEMGLEREGQQLSTVVMPVSACASPIMVDENPMLNAFANGKAILITSGMVKFCKDDNELGLILGHELAHNNRGHMEAKQNNSMIGALLFDLPIAIFTGVNPNIGSQVGAQAYSQDFETEADYVGLYHTARAGYDIAGVSDLWRRMAVENPEAVTKGTTHPTTANRFVVLEAAVKEIEAKRATGQALEPNMKAGE